MKKIFDIIFKFGIGLTVQKVVGSFSGFIMSTYLLLIYNFETSIIILFFIRLATSSLLIWLYDKFKIDWLLIESFKESIEKKKLPHIKNNVIKIIQKGKFLLILWDPTITVLAYRKESYKWNGIPNKKIFFIFLFSLIISTIAWTLVVAIPLWLLDYIK